MNARETLEFSKKNGVVMVDLKFTDLPGMWQHFSIPVSEFSEEIFEDGLGFDGSSIRGWQSIESSDMLVMPDASSAILDPFTQHPTLSMICDIVDPITRERYSRDPRHVAFKALNYLKLTNIGDEIYFGPEAEFFILNSARFHTGPSAGYYYLDSREGAWNSGAEEPGGNLAYKPRYKEGYFPVSPTDSFQDIRSEMVLELEKSGVEVEAQHHEVGTGGQGEIDMKFSPIVTMADRLMLFKYILKNVAKRHGLTLTFMPKPVFEENGNGMHCHQSIWKASQPLFAGDKYAGFSDMGLWYIGGILKHAKALLAFTNPTTNSYRRLVPGYEAPINLAYSSRNRSAACRIPMYSPSPKAKRVEVRFPDPSCNPYLAFAAMAMAGIDGIENKIHPGEPLDKDLYSLSPEEAAGVPKTPATLDEALDHLELDNDFLRKGDVFTPDLIETWLQYRRKEITEVQLRPHPHEFELYYDA